MDKAYFSTIVDFGPDQQRLTNRAKFYIEMSSDAVRQAVPGLDGMSDEAFEPIVHEWVTTRVNRFVQSLEVSYTKPITGLYVRYALTNSGYPLKRERLYSRPESEPSVIADGALIWLLD